MTLYEIPEEYLELCDMMDDKIISSDTFYECLEKLNGDLKIKMNGYLKVMDEKQAIFNSIDEEVTRLNERKKQYEKNLSNMKDGLLKVMLAMNIKSIELPLHTLNVQNSKGKVVIDSMADIPSKFKKTKTDVNVDKIALGKYLSTNGDQLYAHLEESKTLKVS